MFFPVYQETEYTIVYGLLLCMPASQGRSPCSLYSAHFLAEIVPLKLTAMQHSLLVLARLAAFPVTVCSKIKQSAA